MKNETTIGLLATLLLHLLLGAGALLLRFETERSLRPAFIEVTLGEFRTGSPAREAPERVEEQEAPAEPRQQTQEPEVQPVDLPDEVLPVESEVSVETPTGEEPQTETTEGTTDPSAVRVGQVGQAGQGAAAGGTPGGTGTRSDAEQGTGQDQEIQSPYSLAWEGNLGRDPQVQPLPVNTTNISANIAVRIEVYPDGRVGRVLPLRKMNPELEREVIRTLRNWRFSRLPASVPQEPQWGTITFRFIVE